MNAPQSNPTDAPLSARSDRSPLDDAFAALAEYDSGTGRGALLPIDEAVKTALDNDRARSTLEKRLTSVLESDASPVAKAYACRKLAILGTASCVPALMALLQTEDHADTALRALQAIPDAASATALRRSLGQLKGLHRIGVVNALGMRGEASSAEALADLLENEDSRTAAAAAAALGNIGTPVAARALLTFRSSAPDTIRLTIRLTIADACLACAERLVAAENRKAAAVLYRALANAPYPERVRAAATRGLSTLPDR